MNASAFHQQWSSGPAKIVDEDFRSQRKRTVKELPFLSVYDTPPAFPDANRERILVDGFLTERRQATFYDARNREPQIQDSHRKSVRRRDEVTSFVALLRACAKSKDLARGSSIHNDVRERGLTQSCSDALISMYARCGALSEARALLDLYGSKNACCWTAVITECTRHHLGLEALAYFEKMQSKGLSPDSVTFASVLKACGISKEIGKGEQIHDLIVQKGFLEKDLVLGTAVVDMYAKCGLFLKAQKVLEELPLQDISSWNALINGYAQEGKVEQAFSCFERMKNGGFSPNAVSYICMLKACSTQKAIHCGEQIHDEIVRQGLLKHNPKLVTALVDMYAKCGASWKAQQTLENLASRNVYAWSALITGFTQQGLAQEALNCFDRMRGLGIPPDAVTFASILKACGALGALTRGEQIHEEIQKDGMLNHSSILGVALLDMYIKCGAITKARSVFDRLSSRNVVAWNALLTGYNHHGLDNHVLSCFKQMQCEGILSDSVTYACVLKACGALRALDEGKQVHKEISNQCLLQNNTSLGTALLDMYAKVGALSEARKVFDELPSRDAVSWSALIAGYAQHGQGDQGLVCFEEMEREDISPDAVTFACVLKACAQAKAIDKGKLFHDRVAKQGLLSENMVLGNALVDMYVKCGDLEKAEIVLKELHTRDVVSYSTLMVGYAHFGQSKRALDCFRSMRDEGVRPDALTYCCVLSACSHLGLVEDGYLHFVDMTSKYGLQPDEEHYTCMVDLFGRSGHLDKAVHIIQKMPLSNCYVLWSALLAACRKWGDVNVASWAFEHALQLDKSNATAYVLMVATYAMAGMDKEAKMVEALRQRNRAHMKRTYSSRIQTSVYDSFHL